MNAVAPKKFESREQIMESLRQERNLEGADMSGLDLSGIKLAGLSMKGVDLHISQSRLVGVDVTGADFSDVTTTDARGLIDWSRPKCNRPNSLR